MDDKQIQSGDQNHVFTESVKQPEPENAYRPIMAAPEPDPNAQNQQGVFTNPMVDPNQQYAGYQDPYGVPPVNDPYFQVGSEVQPEVQKTTNKDRFNEAINKLNLKRINDFLIARWWLVLLLLIAFCVVSLGIYSFFGNRKTYGPTDFLNVKGGISAPQTSPSGNPNRWSITIQNKEQVSIQNIEVKLNFDRSFRYNKPINPDPAVPEGNIYRFPSLAAVGQGTSDLIIQFEGILAGNIDEDTKMTGEVSYTPSPLLNDPNGKRTVSLEAATTKITSPQIQLSITPSAQSIENGGGVELNIAFQNLSERELKDLRIRVDYPDAGNFAYASSTLTLSTTSDTKTKPDDANNIWFINSLPRLKQQTLNIKGILSGAEGVKQGFKVEIAVKSDGNNYQTLSSSATDVAVTAQPLALNTRISGKDSVKTFNPGETLNFVIEYQNRGTATLKNVEIYALIDDPANILDYNSVVFVGGDSGNLNNKILGWRGSGTPQLVNLTPQVKGQIQYSIRVKDGSQFVQSSLNQNTYTMRPRVQGKASNLDQVEVAGELYKARGDIQFTQDVSDAKEVTPQSAKYTVTWTLRTRQNKINDVVVDTVSNLPPEWFQSGWRPSITPGTNAGQLNYDAATGKITWKPGNLNNYVGLSSPIVSIGFDIVVATDSADKPYGYRNRQMFGQPNIRGVDDFTGESYQQTGSPATAR
jgi:uncharacterized repeat protein (TIGR01451 family)